MIKGIDDTKAWRNSLSVAWSRNLTQTNLEEEKAFTWSHNEKV